MTKTKSLKNIKEMLEIYISKVENYSGFRPDYIVLSKKDYNQYVSKTGSTVYDDIQLRKI